MNGGIRVAVTGASGFIGRGVLESLAESQVPVRALSRRPAPDWATAAEWTVLSDYGDTAQATEALQGTSHLLHLADDPRRDRRRGTSEATRIVGALCAAAERNGLRGAILASSTYARSPKGPGSYGARKASMEERFLASSLDQLVVLRLPPVYGPGGRGGLATLAGLVRRGLPLPLGLAAEPRQYLSRSNLVALVSAIVASRAPVRGVFEPSDGLPIATRDLVLMMGEVLGRKPMLLPVPLPLLRGLGALTGRSELVRGAVDRLDVAGADALEVAFGWQPQERMPESLSYLKNDLKPS